MNTLNLLLEKDLPRDLLAFYPLDGVPIRFGELQNKAIAARTRLQELGVEPGSSVLLADQISAEFYACVMAVLSLGATVILVEPYLPLFEIENVVSSVRPRVMIASLLGRAWGIRSKSIRQIPHWVSAKALCEKTISGKLVAEKVSPDFPGIITFTSGTTGKSKGVIRTHSGLIAQNLAIHHAAEFDRYQGPDLAIFANLVLANLGMGRGTVFVPPRWKLNDLKKIASLPKEFQPETLSCGPAFFSQLLKIQELPSLQSIHIGGALTDCSVFEQGFQRFSKDTRFIHVYGSSEAEPVAFSDAKVAVEESRNRGFVQTLLLGNSIPEIETIVESDGFWVTGPHVCRQYIGNESENAKTKRIDHAGRVWHCMGDRIERDSTGLWYRGRSFQTSDDFLLEQKVYSFLQNTSCFIDRANTQELVLVGEGVSKKESELKRHFPEINRVIEARIKRDRRHRARIDRGASR